jgi:hypothetical protein
MCGYSNLLQKVGGKAHALPPPCPWVVFEVLQSCEILCLNRGSLNADH